jgi:hexokinase
MQIHIDTYSINELTEFTQRFFKELILWEQGKSRDFSYLKTKITKLNLVTDGEQFQIMTIGGSKLESCIGVWKDGKLNIKNTKTLNIPVFDTKEVFLEFVCTQIDQSQKILALNLAYPVENVERQGRLDARLLRGTKEHSFGGLIDHNIGEEIEKYLESKLNKQIKVIVANDLVCLLNSTTNTVNTAAAIIGTGFNLGFIENNKLVNLEAGNFAGFRQTDTGIVIDKNSANQGHQKFEKEVSGAYLHRHYNILAKRYSFAETESTITLGDLAANGIGEESKIAQTLIDRSAALVACQIAGLYYFMGEQEMNWIIEGGIFYKTYKYQTSVKKYLKKLEVDMDNIKFLKPANAFIGVGKLVQ